MRRFPLQVLIAGALLAGGIGLRIADPEPVARLRLSVFDSYLRAAPRAADPAFPVKVVAIDEPSLREIGQWPWPRSRLAALVDRLAGAGARSITFDFLLVEPDRLSPGELVRALDGQEELRPLLSEIARLPSNDERLARSIAAAPVVLGLVGDAAGGGSLPAARASISFAGDDPAAFVHAFPRGIASLDVLTGKAAGLGAVNWLPARDQIVRHVPLLVSVAGRLYPSLALEALRVGTGQSTILVKSSGGSGLPGFGQRTGPELVRVGETVIPSNEKGELWLKLAPSDPRRTVSAHRILSGDFDPAAIRSRHVLVGATAAGLLDLRATPLDPSVPGVEIHAQALEQMLSGDHLVRPAYTTGAEVVFMVLAGALVTWLVVRSAATVALAAAVAAIGLVVLTSRQAYAQAGVLLDPVYPSLVLALLYVGASVTSYVRAELDRARIRSAFGHYVAPSLVAELARHPDKLRLGGETRTVTLLFADVRGFSTLSEGLDAEELVRFVNRLFTPLTETILASRGTIDKFLGDAVMAFWNAPVPDPDHAVNACRAALAMQADLSRLNDALVAEREQGGPAIGPVRMGIGVNTGACVVGNVGSPQRFDYSVLGDAVNVAARFEDATKTSGADIVVGAVTAAAAPELAFLEIGTVVPRGKARPERIFALIGDEAMSRSPEFGQLKRVHAELLAAIASEDRSAVLAALERCRAQAPASAARLYGAIAARWEATP